MKTSRLKLVFFAVKMTWTEWTTDVNSILFQIVYKIGDDDAHWQSVFSSTLKKVDMKYVSIQFL